MPYNFLSKECERTYNNGNITRECAKDIKAFSQQYKHQSAHLDILDPKVMNEDIRDRHSYIDVKCHCDQTVEVFKEFIKQNKLQIDVKYYNDDMFCNIKFDTKHKPPTPFLSGWFIHQVPPWSQNVIL
jgi:hypothetical protein